MVIKFLSNGVCPRLPINIGGVPSGGGRRSYHAWFVYNFKNDDTSTIGPDGVISWNVAVIDCVKIMLNHRSQQLFTTFVDVLCEPVLMRSIKISCDD
ncbi:hypothetical protein DERF_005042 [Dermatophagoides farinae]|uniref:Uncharacterized protein n=1 Tax=Dermatophagoides farinae TaxID=6954 RepID=A0A922L6S1_DERFA|nr:hypothetical protein DERF_005042 [Dermatophagoides farinae]